MRLTPRRPDLAVGPGERLLAWAALALDDDARVVGGTRDALYLPVGPGDGDEPARRVPWEQVQAADWDLEAETLRVSEVGAWGEVRPEHSLRLEEPGRLLQLVRERVTASVVLQRHVPITGRNGVRVIARRAPGRRGDVTWLYEYDEGVDPDDPFVVLAAEDALRTARDEVGPG